MWLDFRAVELGGTGGAACVHLAPPSASLQPPEVGATGTWSPFCTLALPR